jgi:hypothetical protein
VPVGWRERVDLPELGLTAIDAKIDTGARTSALHVDLIEELAAGADGLRHIRILRRAGKSSKEGDRVWDLTSGALRQVKSSNGQVERRYVVRTRMVLGPVSRTIELTLTDRRGMRHEMLVGRTALRGAFLVDAGKSYLC